MIDTLNTSEPIPTKQCSRCGRILPATSFHGSSKSKDGLQSQCKDCHRESNRRAAKRRYDTSCVINTKALKGDPSSPLAEFTPQQLIKELQDRGFHGELQFVNVIKV